MFIKYFAKSVVDLNQNENKNRKFYKGMGEAISIAELTGFRNA